MLKKTKQKEHHFKQKKGIKKKFMKKILALLIAVSVAFALAACASHEETGSESIKAETTNDSGERALTEVDESVEEYEAELFEGDLYLVKYNGASKNVVVPSVYNGKPVYGIDTKCFKDNTTIEKIEFRDIPKVGKLTGSPFAL